MVLFVLVFGSIFAYKTYQLNHRMVSVQPVSNINWGYWGDTESSYGMVTNDSAQEIYVDASATIQDIYVAEGDVVEVGDKLLAYDMRELNISIARKQLEISTTENEIALAEKRLQYLKTASPVDKTPPQINEDTLTELEEQDNMFNSIPEKDEMSGVYNYVTSESIPSNAMMDLETGELSYYKIEDDEKNRWSIYRLYIAGDELYAEVTPVYSSGEHKLVRLAVEDTRESNYTIEHYGKEFFMKIEDITK